MNRRTLLSRLPLLAALPWVARWLGAEIVQPTKPSGDPRAVMTYDGVSCDAHVVLGDAQEPWPPGLDWADEPVLLETYWRREHDGSYRVEAHLSNGVWLIAPRCFPADSGAEIGDL